MNDMKIPTDAYVRKVYARAPVTTCEHDNQSPDYAAEQFDLWLAARDAAIRADIAAEVLAATWDEVGGSMWFDRHQWGVIIDGLVLQRAEALTRKAANEYSNSDERAEMCVDLIRQINAADPLALSTAKEASE